jgi:hypothetical protein
MTDLLTVYSIIDKRGEYGASTEPTHAHAHIGVPPLGARTMRDLG